MVTRPRREPEPPGSHGRPATTPQGRENQMISLAFDLVEQRLRDGTASATETVALMKLGSSRERLEQQRIQHENELMVVKKEAMEASVKSEALFRDAMDYFRAYTGNGPAPTESDQDE
ncbi:hypothetical protein SEA_SCAP1_1 [Streptomyces phage Scap1]|uniref:Uncharacterized protein n=1 Tax=Streptomyces phage Scap1 TaxID=2041354 RepID=A0A2D1GNZ6_9CAUD|nr:hypothetical protein FDI71_gp01 [Streptomyces phage Scap1]ATN93651.1 hypothetical protein SEA_SCAP1_1 [Streptomyces phage Scap1]